MSAGAPFDLSLLSRTARVDDTGRVSIGGCDLTALADDLGTPLYVYDEDELRARCREYRVSFPGGAAYAGKAFLCAAMVRLVAEEGLDLDVASGGELHVALAAGFPAERVHLHGNNKSTDELRRALTAGIGQVIVDSGDELDRIDALVAKESCDPPDVLVRINPGVDAHTHEYLATGVVDSKFGFPLLDDLAFDAVVRIADSATARFGGLHAHIGSQILRREGFAAALERLAALIVRIEREVGIEVDEVNIGGGLGVRYVASDEAPTIAQHAALVREDFGAAIERAGADSRPRLSTEPGRSIAAPAGVTLYRVGTVKTIPGLRTYVSVDGGMSDNARPALYGAQYEAFVPSRATAPRDALVTIAGKHCEQGDLLVRDAELPGDIVPGDVVCTPVTGAYGYAMASNYNKLPRPAVVFVRDGVARVVVRRETFDDLLRSDVF
jgi:diaminopimelate decarboxylase